MGTAEYSLLLRVVENLGTTGLLIFVVYRIMDRWASKLIGGYAEQSTLLAKQTGAIVELATSIRESHGEQREVVLAMRVLAAKVEATRGWIREVSEASEQRAREEMLADRSLRAGQKESERA